MIKFFICQKFSALRACPVYIQYLFSLHFLTQYFISVNLYYCVFIFIFLIFFKGNVVGPNTKTVVMNNFDPFMMTI
jgi:hypothetical protein